MTNQIVMNTTVSIIAVVILIAAFLLMRRRQSGANQRPDPQHDVTGSTNAQFHAVSLEFSSHACAVAKAMDGKRFLSIAAPRIPLPDCDVLECKCRFVHYKDRRSGGDRRSPFGSSIDGGTGKYAQERRQPRDRRKDAPDDF